MKLSTLQISLGLSLLTHGVIFSAISFIQSGAGTCSQTDASPISFALVADAASTDAKKSSFDSILEPPAPAPPSASNSNESIAPPAESEPVVPTPSPEVASEN